jgi:Uma2 family endonuclease
MSVATIADLLEQLGGVPPHRVRLHPYPGTATEDDVREIEARENRLFELVDGVLVEKAMGFYESLLAVELASFLKEFVRRNDLGVVAGPDGMMRLASGRVRIPNVSFISWDRLPGRQTPRAPIPDLAHDLAAEVLSEGNTPKEMELKLGEYFRSGVRLVWYVDHETRSVRAFTAPDRFVTLGEDETLNGGEVLPGFALPLRELFELADRRQSGPV